MGTGQLLKGKIEVRLELPPELKPAALWLPLAVGFLAGIVFLLALQSVFTRERR